MIIFTILRLHHVFDLQEFVLIFIYHFKGYLHPTSSVLIRTIRETYVSLYNRRLFVFAFFSFLFSFNPIIDRLTFILDPWRQVCPVSVTRQPTTWFVTRLYDFQKWTESSSRKNFKIFASKGKWIFKIDKQRQFYFFE